MYLTYIGKRSRCLEQSYYISFGAKTGEGYRRFRVNPNPRADRRGDAAGEEQ